MNNAPPPDDSDREQDDVVQFPEKFSAEHVTAQKRLAQQLVTQMPKDPREQRAVLRYMSDLLFWQQQPNGEGPPEN